MESSYLSEAPSSAEGELPDLPELPLPLDLTHLFSEVSKLRTESRMKQYYKYFLIPGIGNISGGLPNVQFFPFDTLEAQTATPDRWTPSPNDPEGFDIVEGVGSMKLSNTSERIPSVAHINVPKISVEKDLSKKIDLLSALQYGTAQGYPPLYSWIKQFVRESLHPNIPYRGGPEVILTTGSTDGFSKTLELFVDPWVEGIHDPRDRPGLLCETFVYGSILNQAQPKGVQIVSVVADEGGMMTEGPGGLEDVLANWDEENGRRPHLMYTVSMGHNPTGIVMSVERRKAIYALCSRFDVIIVEDDPYFYLQYPSATIEQAKSRNEPIPERIEPAYQPEKSSGFPYLDSLVPSFLSVDTDGRVVRLDTFSKTVAPGCRLGFITAQPEIVERYLRITEVSTQQPSGFVQSMISELIMGAEPADAKAAFQSLRTRRERDAFSGWHFGGWVRWLEGLRGEYERRMQRMCRILDAGRDQIKTGTPVAPGSADWGIVTKTRLYDYTWPRGGMFVWVRLNYETHPLWQVARPNGALVSGMDLASALMLFLTRKPFLVLISLGFTFSSTPKVREEVGWAYMRLCFAAESEEGVDACSQRWVDGIHKFWRVKKVEDLEAILGDVQAAELEDDLASEDMGNLGAWLGC